MPPYYYMQVFLLSLHPLLFPACLMQIQKQVRQLKLLAARQHGSISASAAGEAALHVESLGNKVSRCRYAFEE